MFHHDRHRLHRGDGFGQQLRPKKHRGDVAMWATAIRELLLKSDLRVIKISRHMNLVNQRANKDIKFRRVQRTIQQLFG